MIERSKSEAVWAKRAGGNRYNGAVELYDQSAGHSLGARLMVPEPLRAELLNVRRHEQARATVRYSATNIVILHSIPGRMRVKVSAIRYLEGRAHFLQVRLSERRELVLLQRTGGHDEEDAQAELKKTQE